MYGIREIRIDSGVVNHPVARRISSRFRGLVQVTDIQALYQHLIRAADPVQRAKEILFLTRHQGAFIRKCPGTRNYICCDYQILHIGSFCPMDCAYCILQAYFHPPVWQFFVNHEDLLNELEGFFQQRTFRRLGTGEFTDSLIWESLSDLNRHLITRFGQQTGAVLELKTKTVAIDALQYLPHHRKTILAWSLNTPDVIRTLERRTASLPARLAAAQKAVAWGYPVAFHFDPLVLYDGCEDDYAAVINRLFDVVDARQIVWISLGALRFMPELKPLMEQRFSGSTVTGGELITGMDGKLRYFKPLRIRLLKHLVRQIETRAPQVCVYFCMEDDEVWHKVTGRLPSDEGGLPYLLDQAAVRVCQLENYEL